MQHKRDKSTMLLKTQKKLRFVRTLGLLMGGLSLANIAFGKTEDYFFNGPYKNSCTNCHWVSSSIYSCSCTNKAHNNLSSAVNTDALGDRIWDLYNCDGQLTFQKDPPNDPCQNDIIESKRKRK